MESLIVFGSISGLLAKRMLTKRVGPTTTPRRFSAPKERRSFSGPFIISLDQGTSSSRAVLYDRNCQAILSHQEIIHCEPVPNVEWAEQDPLLILKSSQECINQVVQKAQSQLDLTLNQTTVLGLGVTNQRETTIVWDTITGKPLYNAILWYDNRTAEIVKEMIHTHGSPDSFRQKTGLVFSSYFSAVKLCWLLRNIEPVRKAIDENRCMFGTVDSWLIWNLTGGTKSGVHLTDVTNASRTMLMNIETMEWDKELLKAFNIPASILPAIKSSSEKFGLISYDQINSDIHGVPIMSCLGDQQAALIGQLCFKEGSSKCTYGTGCFILYNTGNKIVQSKNGLLTTVGYQLGPNAKPVYALEGSISVAGSGYDFIRDNLKAVKTVHEIDGLVTSVPDNGGVYCVPAFTGLLAPYWNPDARGVLTGITHQTTLAHISRAIVESIPYNVNDIAKGAVRDSGLELHSIVVDGGASKSNFMLQMQSNMCQVPVYRATDAEATCRGAAIAAGLAADLYNLDELVNEQKSDDGLTCFLPNISIEEKTKLEIEWSHAVQLACVKPKEIHD